MCLDCDCLDHGDLLAAKESASSSLAPFTTPTLQVIYVVFYRKIPAYAWKHEFVDFAKGLTKKQVCCSDESHQLSYYCPDLIPALKLCDINNNHNKIIIMAY